MNEHIDIIEYVKSMVVSLYKETAKNDKICILCEGSHGDNSLCQMSVEDNHEVF